MLVAAAAVLVAAACLRGLEYDETYSLLLTAGTARPAWPRGVFQAGAVANAFTGHAAWAGLARDLRATDVHPPLYFWTLTVWRDIAGPGLVTARLLSVVYSVAGLICLAQIGRRAGIPPVWAVAFAAGCYGFAYTGSIARGFALAQLLLLGGVLLAIGARGALRGFAAGLVLGAATFANYLAAFVGLAALGWMLRTRIRSGLCAAAGFASFLPADLWFFLAQRASRSGQFPPFHWLPSLARLARYSAATLFGGLPLYCGAAAPMVSAILGGFCLVLAGLVAWRRKKIPHFGLFAGSAAAPSLGLLALGLLFNTTPIELRYLAFGAPFLALLLAGAIASLRPTVGRSAALAVLSLQALALAGLLTRPETMQPQQQAVGEAAAVAQGGLVLLPRGNDGVGVAGAFIAQSPPSLRILIVDKALSAAQLLAQTRAERRVVIALLGLDAESRATLPVVGGAFATDQCWRWAEATRNIIAYDRVCED
ncbi:MAG: glycosyltransferase family 39 protein [Acetobacteraceae bacterium]|nr:glycosyltransferase family 39 protein [Acetobacteraceae bacterium]